MGIEYKLGRSETGYQHFSCSKDAKAIIRDMGIYGFGDCIGFHKRNRDGSAFGSEWGLRNLGCFRELRPYDRLMHMPNQAVRNLAARIYGLLYMNYWGGEKWYRTPPKVSGNNPRFRQILEELTALQATEKRLAESGKIVFPEISQEELACQDSW